MKALEVGLGCAENWFVHDRLSRFQLSVQCLSKIKRSVIHSISPEALVEIKQLAVCC